MNSWPNSRILASPVMLARMSDSAPTTRLNAALVGRYRMKREIDDGIVAEVDFVVRVRQEPRPVL